MRVASQEKDIAFDDVILTTRLDGLETTVVVFPDFRPTIFRFGSYRLEDTLGKFTVYDTRRQNSSHRVKPQKLTDAPQNGPAST